MPRWSLLALFAVGCTGNTGIILGDSDTADLDTDPPVDPHHEYDGANLRITSPESGAFLFLEDPRTFSAVVRDANAAVMPFTDIHWSSDADATWVPVGDSFEDTALAPGVHNITAEAALPNGDRVAHTIGGVRLQSRWTGTYTGLFTTSVNVTIQNTPVTLTCSGAATLGVDRLGATATGDSNCLLAISTFSIPAAFAFDLTNDNGALSGAAAVDLGFLGTFQIGDASGTIDPSSYDLALTFNGAMPQNGTIDGSVDATRVSLDPPQ